MIADGTKLFRMIKNNEIEDGTKIYMEPSISTDHRYYTVVKKHGEFDVWRENLYGEIKAGVIRPLTVADLNKYDFVIPEDEEINIQAIEEFRDDYCVIQKEKYKQYLPWSEKEKEIVKQQNKIIKAIKQLDNKIKEK